jgi:indolepyruvate ferredoxin oxidoreductase
MCVVAAGRTFVETRHALRRLGLGDAELKAGGVRLVKIGMIFPLDRDIIRQAASGVQQVLVVEEKRSFLELFVRGALYGTAGLPPSREARRGRPTAGSRRRGADG